MMSLEYLRKAVGEDYNDFFFEYNEKKSGLEVQAENGIITYQVWHGNDIKEYDDLDEAFNDPFYSGKSIAELVNEVEIEFG